MAFPHRRGEEGHHHHHPHGHEENRHPPAVAYVYEPSPPPPHHVTPAPSAAHGPHHPPPPEPHFVQVVPAHPPPHHAPELPQGHLVRVFCKKDQAFNLAVEHNSVIMKPANTQDEAQQWIKDESYGMRVKDNYGFPAFSLVNKKTRMILNHAKKKGQQVLLLEYKPDIKDDDILWSESEDFGEGFRTVRCASDTLLNLTVSEGVKSVRNGSALVLDTWHKGDHQLWKVFPL